MKLFMNVFLDLGLTPQLSPRMLRLSPLKHVLQALGLGLAKHILRVLRNLLSGETLFTAAYCPINEQKKLQ